MSESDDLKVNAEETTSNDQVASSPSSTNLRQLPPLPQTNNDEANTLRYYLKQAVEARNLKAIKDLLARCTTKNILPPTDELVIQAVDVSSQLDSSNRTAEVETLTFYLKQALELKNKDAIKVALSKAEAVELGNARMYSDFVALMNEARRTLEAMDKETAQTLSFYLKQGIQMRNREVLKESLAKANHMRPGSLDTSVVEEASNILKQLDAENLILFYVDSAIKQKDMDALEQALSKAQALKMNPSLDKLKEGTEMLHHLKRKKRYSTSGTPGKGLFAAFSNSNLNNKKKSELERKLFGGSLEDAISRSRYIVPNVCYVCLEFIKKNGGLQEPGLFRVSGNADVMDVIRHHFEDDEEVKLDDVNDAAGVFKQYLRQLPEPLFPFNTYKDVVAVAQQFPSRDPGRAVALKEHVAKLPLNNRNLLSYLMYFLHTVTQNEEHTKMNASNLAIVFAPNLLRPLQETPESMLTEMPACIGLVSTMIESPDHIFDPLPDDLTRPTA